MEHVLNDTPGEFSVAMVTEYSFNKKETTDLFYLNFYKFVPMMKFEVMDIDLLGFQSKSLLSN